MEHGKMKRKRLLIPLCLLSVVCVTIAQSPLRSATEPDYPPFSMVTPEGEADGLAVDMLKAAVEAMGLDITFKTGPWNQIKSDLASGELDVLPLVGRTPERETLYDFTVPYLTLHGALFVRDDEAEIRSLADLPGKRIAVMKGDNAEEYVLRAKLSDQILSTTSFKEAFHMLAKGEADAVIAQKLMGVSLLKGLSIKNVKVVGKPNEEFKQDFCFAVQKGNSELLARLNEGLAIVNASGIAQQLKKKWMTLPSYESAQIRKLLFIGGSTYPPLQFLNEEGQPTGFNIELVRALSRTTGLDISIQLLPWSQARQMAETGELDLTTMLYSEDRDLKMDFSGALLASPQVVFSRKDSPKRNSQEDLKDFRVAVQKTVWFMIFP
jgi:two-component system sensor histidine kinase EvgS